MKVELGTAIVVLLLPGIAQAWEPIDPRWSTWCADVPFSMNEAGSADLGPSSSRSELARAFADWQAVSCADLSVIERATTSAQPGVFDGHSVSGWVESNWRHAPEAIGMTGTLMTQGTPSCITEADMELNGVHYTWVLGSGSEFRVNTYSIALHEGGHYLGLGHSSDRSATMYYAYQGGIDEIGSDDIAGICSLYPTPNTDCTTLGCPNGQMCVAGQCEFVQGDGSPCAPCQTDDQCGGPNDFCLRYPDELRYCGRFCQSDADCPADNEFCARTSGLSQCARVDEDGKFDCNQTTDECVFDTDCEPGLRCEQKSCVSLLDTGNALGESCEVDMDCRHGLCALSNTGRVCSRTCNWLRPGSCAATGRYCAATSTGTCGIGLCLPGEAGDGTFGSACSRDTDCESLFCIESRCSVACAGSVEPCPGDTQCLSTDLTGCSACSEPKVLGDMCRSFEECPDRLCAEEGERSFCTKTCIEETDCPSGFECKEAGNVRVCRPPDGFGQDAGTRRAGGSRGGCGCAALRPDQNKSWILGLLLAGLCLRTLRRWRA